MQLDIGTSREGGELWSGVENGFDGGGGGQQGLEFGPNEGPAWIWVRIEDTCEG